MPTSVASCILESEAAFEILYNLGEAALPLLRKIAFGEYDWTQGNAIEILRRWAAEGVDREQS
jgi:hypothetical protein